MARDRRIIHTTGLHRESIASIGSGTQILCRHFPNLSQLLTAVENGGAGRSKMVALGGVDLP